jgi:hypothetical protein
VPELSGIFFPTPMHKFLPPRLYYGIPVPHNELLRYVDDGQLYLSAPGEWADLLGMERRGLDEDPVDEDGNVINYELEDEFYPARRAYTQDYALLHLEQRMGIPKNTLKITGGLTTRGDLILSFYSNYHGRDAVKPEQIRSILDLIGVKDSPQPLWYLGSTGSWKRRTAKTSQGRNSH